MNRVRRLFGSPGGFSWLGSGRRLPVGWWSRGRFIVNVILNRRLISSEAKILELAIDLTVVLVSLFIRTS